MTKTKFAIIAAMSNNNVIGCNNKIPWQLNDDLKRFKTLTNDHVIIMGKKTFESLGNMPLSNRYNIILTNDYNLKEPEGYPDDKNTDIKIVHSIEMALEAAKYYNDNDLEVFIIGGSSIYKQFMKYCYRLYMTRIYKDFDGDTFFPTIDEKTWDLVWSNHIDSDKFNYQYEIYNRKNQH
jgi:dihydrofolate reductase